MRKMLLTAAVFALATPAAAGESAQTQVLSDHFVKIGEVVCAKQATPAACEIQFNGLAIRLYIEPNLGDNKLLRELADLVAKYASISE